MRIKLLKPEFTLCKLRDMSRLNLAADLFFFSRTPDEISLVCPSEEVPSNTVTTDSGWKAFRVEGPLEFTMVGVLSRLATMLAERGISIFAISTYDTDYILVKAAMAENAKEAFQADGHEVV